MSLIKRFFSPPDESARKTITYRGGVVTFRIPAHWREEYSDMDGGMFYDKRFGSGTLRLTIITATSPRELHASSSLEMLKPFVKALKAEKGVEGSIQERNDGNAVLKYEEAGFERGKELTIFFWVVANPLPPRHARLATFSYTILAKQRDQSRIQRDLQMLESEIEAARFTPELGE